MSARDATYIAWVALIMTEVPVDPVGFGCWGLGL